MGFEPLTHTCHI